MEECQKDHKSVTHVVSESIDKLTERLGDVERRFRNMPTVNSMPNFDWHNETIKHVAIEKDASRGPLDDSHSTDKLPVSHNKENKPQINCDHLILTDSILGRIQPKRFTPKSKTIKRFIKGGVVACHNFVEKYGPTFIPKNVLLESFTQELETSKTWE